MSTQETILQYSKEARAWFETLSPFLLALLTWLLPSPLPKKVQLKKPNEPLT